MSEHKGEFLIVTGMSGAGRSTVANALEDLGWYVVDNLPPEMLRPLLDLSDLGGSALPKLAAVVGTGGRSVGASGRSLLDDFPGIARTLRARGSLEVLFLDATDEVLVRRFESVRRPHPLQGDGTIIDGILQERVLLAPVREAADVVIDTSALNIHQLANETTELFANEGEPRHKLTLLSFGFKYGLPTDVDFIADVRFLPNPYWNEELRALTGQDETVRDYVLSREGASLFLDSYSAALVPVLEGYQRENKSHSTVAIGCTGGKHRSVAMSVALASRLSSVSGVAITVRHRDLGRE